MMLTLSFQPFFQSPQGLLGGTKVAHYFFT